MAESGPLAFYFDLASPQCYLAAERIMHALPGPIDWRPVRIANDSSAPDAYSRAVLERRASELGLLPLRWPARYPFDSEPAMIVATYARAIGRGVAYAQAAFRQAFAGGHSLAETDYVLLAAAACEMHPNAVKRALTQRALREQLAKETNDARRSGVTALPAVIAEKDVFSGEHALAEAAAHLSGSTATQPRGHEHSPRLPVALVR